MLNLRGLERGQAGCGPVVPPSALGSSGTKAFYCPHNTKGMHRAWTALGLPPKSEKMAVYSDSKRGPENGQLHSNVNMYTRRVFKLFFSLYIVCTLVVCFQGPLS